MKKSLKILGAVLLIIAIVVIGITYLYPGKYGKGDAVTLYDDEGQTAHMIVWDTSWNQYYLVIVLPSVFEYIVYGERPITSEDVHFYPGWTDKDMFDEFQTEKWGKAKIE